MICVASVGKCERRAIRASFDCMTTPAPLGPLIVTALMGAADQAWAEGLRRAHFPPERNQVPAHISLFHHLPPSMVNELRTLLGSHTAAPPPPAELTEIFSLGRGVALKLHCPGLLAIRAEIADRFEHHLIPQDRAVPRLHVTVQNKVDPAQARATLEALRAQIKPRPLAIAALMLWSYRGGPWDLVSRHPFRG